MKVDISPNFPPSSSCTADAPCGSGSDGGGISVCSRSIRRIMRGPLDWTVSNQGYRAYPAGNLKSANPAGASALRRDAPQVPHEQQVLQMGRDRGQVLERLDRLLAPLRVPRPQRGREDLLE